MLRMCKLPSLAAILFSIVLITSSTKAISQPIRAIAHRGGVVDSTRPENSLPALQEAILQNYWMVEVDLRLTADSVLITQHDRNFKRYFGVDSTVSSMTWSQISQLQSGAGTRVLTFEEVLQQCKGKIRVMIDNKIEGFNEALFARVVQLLDKYDLRSTALMIGTDESTEYFTGKVKLSCTRKQLEENQQKQGYQPDHYYLFSGNISKDDVQWAAKHKIMVVGVLNHRNPLGNNALAELKPRAEALKTAGVRIFQLDSPFMQLLK